MPTVLVCDTSVLIDLDRSGLIAALFRLPWGIAVPDVLFAVELAEWRGQDLKVFGLQVMELDREGVLLAQQYLGNDVRMSMTDVFALALARTGGHLLLTGDRSLRALAEEAGVTCHGVLWLLDQFENSGLLGPSVLLEALERIAGHSRCRLPIDEVRAREERYRRRLREEEDGGPSGHGTT